MKFLPIRETDVNSRFLKHFPAFKSFLFKSTSKQFSFGTEGEKFSDVWLMSAEHFSLIPFPEFSTKLSTDDLEIVEMKFREDLAYCQIGNLARIYEYPLARDPDTYLKLLKEHDIYGCKSIEEYSYDWRGLTYRSTVFCTNHTCTSTVWESQILCCCHIVSRLKFPECYVDEVD